MDAQQHFAPHHELRKDSKIKSAVFQVSVIDSLSGRTLNGIPVLAYPYWRARVDVCVCRTPIGVLVLTYAYGYSYWRASDVVEQVFASESHVNVLLNNVLKEDDCLYVD